MLRGSRLPRPSRLEPTSAGDLLGGFSHKIAFQSLVVEYLNVLDTGQPQNATLPSDAKIVAKAA